MEQIRKIICSVLGHVDHGKSSILDTIRGSCIIKEEAGAITQAIGASIIPLDVIRKRCGKLLDQLKIKLTIPGLLFIDTPGHAAFTNLRKRGGSLADISILVVDINEGMKPQTEEALEILKSDKTPFIIAANKVDLIQGWQAKSGNLIQNINAQSEDVQRQLDTKLYELVGELAKRGINSERFDRVDDYTKQIAIVPTSASTCQGINEMLMVLLGLAQKFLEQCLKCNVSGNAKGSILEVKETTGLGTTIDVILFDGTLKRNDTIVIGGLDKPIITKVRVLLEPAPLTEMRGAKSKFVQVQEVVASTGVKISAPGLDGAIAGMPIQSCKAQEVKEVEKKIQEEVEAVVMETDQDGVIVKADTLGSLEAVNVMLKEEGIPIRRASIGNINKKDVAEAATHKETQPLLSVILGFNVNADEAHSFAQEKGVSVLISDVIYTLIDNYKKWREEEKKKIEMEKLDKLIRPCKIMLLKGYMFRQSNPAIVGTEILSGSVKSGINVMNKEGKQVAVVKSIQKEQENVIKAEKGEQVAISYEGATVGRQIQEGDLLYSLIPEEDFKQMKALKEYLSKDEIEILKEIAAIMRIKDPMWGI